MRNSLVCVIQIAGDKEAPRQRQPAQFRKVTRYFVPAWWPYLEAKLASPTDECDSSTAIISRKCGCSHGMTALARAGKRLDVAIELGGEPRLQPIEQLAFAARPLHDGTRIRHE
jgi:hypothetical protein